MTVVFLYPVITSSTPDRLAVSLLRDLEIAVSLWAALDALSRGDARSLILSVFHVLSQNKVIRTSSTTSTYKIGYT